MTVLVTAVIAAVTHRVVAADSSGVEITDISPDAVLVQKGEYDVLTFTNSGTFKVSSSGAVDVLVVAGGGGGGGGCRCVSRSGGPGERRSGNGGAS